VDLLFAHIDPHVAIEKPDAAALWKIIGVQPTSKIFQRIHPGRHDDVSGFVDDGDHDTVPNSVESRSCGNCLPGPSAFWTASEGRPTRARHNQTDASAVVGSKPSSNTPMRRNFW